MNSGYRHWTHPVVIGSGQRLLREGFGLRLLDRHEFVRDVIVVSYAPAELDGADNPLFEGWISQPPGSITTLAMAMLGVAPEDTPEAEDARHAG